MGNNRTLEEGSPDQRPRREGRLAFSIGIVVGQRAFSRTMRGLNLRDFWLVRKCCHRAVVLGRVRLAQETRV